MGYDQLTSRDVIGRLAWTLENARVSPWVPMVGMLFSSDQPQEEYPFLGMTPALREWTGGRQSKGFVQSKITVPNLEFESTIEVLVKEMRRDKTGQIQLRIDELVGRGAQHWDKLFSTLINNGDSTTGYDGQYFFDTDHVTPGADFQTAQDNDITVDISTLPVAQHGSVAQPSVGEMVFTIDKCIGQLRAFKDDRGEPINENATSYLVMGPTRYRQQMNAARTKRTMEEGQENILTDVGLNIDTMDNVRLDAASGGNDDVLYVIATDRPQKPFIGQVEVATPGGGQESSNWLADLEIDAQAEGSHIEYYEKKHSYGIKASRNVAYAYWQTAIRCQLV
jgi:phage major head subunit gpT-like protein